LLATNAQVDLGEDFAGSEVADDEVELDAELLTTLAKGAQLR
jgi:hypothetical protein